VVAGAILLAGFLVGLVNWLGFFVDPEALLAWPVVVAPML
jgi:hypothetical protein